LFTDGDTVLMNKRGDKDIWANMYDLPLIETSSQMDTRELLAQEHIIELFGSDICLIETSPVKKHLLTHQRLFVRLIKIQGKPPQPMANWFYINVGDVKKLAIPRIVFLLLEGIFDL
jgi:A/G-specific adenine glycosylase